MNIVQSASSRQLAPIIIRMIHIQIMHLPDNDRILPPFEVCLTGGVEKLGLGVMPPGVTFEIDLGLLKADLAARTGESSTTLLCRASFCLKVSVSGLSKED